MYPYCAMVSLCLCFGVLSASALAGEAASSKLAQTDVFTSRTKGYHTFRIPAVIVSPKGTLLAFCEGRKDSSRDGSPTALVMKRSLDGGKTWGPLRVVADRGREAFMNPCPVVDRQSGEILLLHTHWPPDRHTRPTDPGWTGFTCTVWVTRSADDGATWAKPVNITRMAKKRDWTSVATGPGVGIQLQSGRLVIPCCTRSPSGRRCYTLYSDDHGKSWRIGGEAGGMTDECQVVELADGSLMLNMRSSRGKRRRAIALSNDGGLTWGTASDDAALIEPVCQGTFLRYTDVRRQKKNRLLFANPASTEKRVKMTVRLSYDEGKTWPVAREIHPGGSAYSCLTVLPDGSIGLLYEKDGYRTLTFARLDLEWLSAGKDKLE